MQLPLKCRISLKVRNTHFAELEEKRIAAREAKKAARGRGRKKQKDSIFEVTILKVII